METDSRVRRREATSRTCRKCSYLMWIHFLYALISGKLLKGFKQRTWCDQIFFLERSSWLGFEEGTGRQQDESDSQDKRFYSLRRGLTLGLQRQGPVEERDLKGILEMKPRRLAVLDWTWGRTERVVKGRTLEGELAQGAEGSSTIHRGVGVERGVQQAHVQKPGTWKHTGGVGPWQLGLDSRAQHRGFGWRYKRVRHDLATKQQNSK